MKIGIIIPYFGVFPSYFQLFLNSCKRNPSIDWLIVTDNTTKYFYPSNVNVIQMSFFEFREMVQSKFDFPISLERPYKLCDYKPAYGYIMQSYIKKYDYWGHCDTDIIWGDLEKFLKEDIISKYDKIYDLGHLTLYKNTTQNNERFKWEINGIKSYKEVFSQDKSFIFDELYNGSINNIFISLGIKIFIEDSFADIYTKSSNFLLTYPKRNDDKEFVEKRSDSIFCYEDGKLIRYTKEKNKIYQKEFSYIHLQKRKMNVNINSDCHNFYIIPNSFEKIIMPISVNNWNVIRKKQFNLHYFKLRSKNLKTKIKKMVEKK